MSHVAIFPTWDCQLECAYCSIRHSRIDRTVPGFYWGEWADALPRVLSRGSVVDIAGGEPLLYAGLVDLLHALARAGLHWAITSNLKATPIVKRLCDERPAGCVCLNVSDHRGNPESRVNKLRLREAGYRVNVHRVDHPAAGRNHPEAQIITYQDWAGNQAVDGIARRCTAGAQHWVADPRGDLWRCVVALETGQPPSGNLFTGETQPTGLGCRFGCTSCYTEAPGSWGLEMVEVAECTFS